MEYGSIEELLSDFRSIKLSRENKEFINECRSRFQSNGDLPLETKKQIRVLARYHNRQLSELRASRARARRTNGLRKMGLTMREATELVAQRQQRNEAAKMDTGL